MKQKILFTFLILIFAASVFGQTKRENLLENVEIKFTLEGDPSAHDVGFDNPKSSWKVKYELYVTDFSEMEKLGLVKKENDLKYVAPLVRDKRFNKLIKKKSIKILKGGFARKFLASQTSREATIPVNLPPHVIEIYNRATETPEKNPTFVLFISEKVSVKNSAGAKLKDKYLLTDFSPLKHSDSNKTGDYWDVKIMSLRVKISRMDNGKLVFVGSYVHNW